MATTPAVGQHSLREQNIALVAQQIFTAATPPSRADVATATGLTRATVSALVDRLIAARIVSELPPVAPRRAGRPAVPLARAAGTYVGIGLEVNVGHLSGVVVDLTASTIASRTTYGDFHNSDPAAVLGQLGDLTAKLIAYTRADYPDAIIAGVQIALPGLVDVATSSLRVAPNLGWSDLTPIDTSAIAAHVAGAPLTIGNEANLAALAQLPAERGSHAVPPSFLYVSADVGIGAAIVLDRELFLGTRGWGGELGHVVVDPAGPPCPCGATGCLEQYAGTDALLATPGLEGNRTIAQLLAAAQADDPAARRALDRAGHALGAALADFVNLIDVPSIVLGGAYSELAEVLEPILRAELNTRVLSAPWSSFTIHQAPVGVTAAAVGGARQVLRTVIEDPSRWTQ